MNESLLRSKSHVNIYMGNGGNDSKQFISMDEKPSKHVDIVHEYETYPWPFPDECCDLLVLSHVVEHINPHKKGFIRFMDEAWRILKFDGKVMVATPYAGSMGYYQDPTHVNPCNEITWYYFDPLAKIDNQDLYHYYKPKPWKIEDIGWKEGGNLEVVMQKRREDKTYGADTVELG